MATNQEENAVLDEIILRRRTVRSFKADALPKENIEKIVKAGFAAPYARATGFPLEQIRKFIVIKNGSPAHARAKEMIIAGSKNNLKRLKFASLFNKKLGEKAKALMERLVMVSKKGMPTLETAPYYIVIAERKGIPASETKSMAHAMENMWLKATAMGLGFQLISATGMMSKNKEFMDMLGLNVGEYEIDGCVVGYPNEFPPKRQEIGQAVYLKWME
jgi:nitroreductase